MPFKPLLL
jgi:hypothetical protein